jgi:hypothetical protein
MDQFVLFHFAIKKNERFYQFSVQPGTPWEDVESALDEIKANIITLKEETIKQEAEKKAKELEKSKEN